MSLHVIQTLLNVQIFRLLEQCTVKVLIYMRKTDCEWSLSGGLRELKSKRKFQLGNPKSGRGRLREHFFTKFKSQFKRVTTHVVVTRAGRLRELSQGEL